ncbi:MAG: serine/threonine protein kinase [Deltaproteobacteria bacterium]|nr:serine/threonine protein kinase [Deltaproteobacteria bacterium]
MLGKVLARYRVVEEIGQGGMATVYRGHDTVLNRDVAVKVLHPHLQNRPESKLRFQREAQAVARLSHPNILEIYDTSGPDSPDSFIVTEFIRGQTLRTFVEQHGIPFPEIGLMIAHELAGALGHAHGFGIVHRDVKPENIMIRDDGVLKLTDFGIAQMIDAETLTATGALIGSPAHMPPELLEGKPLDVRSDIFSLGTVFYWLVVGDLPFSGPNPSALLRRIADGDFADPARMNSQVSDRLAAAIRRSLAHEPAERFQTAIEMRAELKAILDDVEIDDAPAELCRFFADVGGYTQVFAKRIVGVLRRRGDEARRRGQVALALANYDRVLSIEPSNPSVLQAVRRVGAARRLWKAAAVAAAVAAVGAGAAVAALVGIDSSGRGVGTEAVAGTEARAVAGAVADAGPGAGAHARAVADSGAGAVAAAGARAVAAAGAGADAAARTARGGVDAGQTKLASAHVMNDANGLPRASARARRDVRETRVHFVEPRRDGTPFRGKLERREVSLVAFPLAAKIFVNREFKGHGRAIVALRPGRHRVRFEAAGCSPWEDWVSVPSNGAMPPVTRSLPWLPAYLTVHSGDEADVYVNGSRKGTTSESARRPIRVQIADTAEGSPHRLVEVRVVRGSLEGRKTVKVTAGLATTTTVQFSSP